jgi:hypothetical protein
VSCVGRFKQSLERFKLVDSEKDLLDIIVLSYLSDGSFPKEIPVKYSQILHQLGIGWPKLSEEGHAIGREIVDSKVSREKTLLLELLQTYPPRILALAHQAAYHQSGLLRLRFPLETIETCQIAPDNVISLISQKDIHFWVKKLGNDLSEHGLAIVYTDLAYYRAKWTAFFLFFSKQIAFVIDEVVKRSGIKLDASQRLIDQYSLFKTSSVPTLREFDQKGLTKEKLLNYVSEAMNDGVITNIVEKGPAFIVLDPKRYEQMVLFPILDEIVCVMLETAKPIDEKKKVQPPKHDDQLMQTTKQPTMVAAEVEKARTEKSRKGEFVSILLGLTDAGERIFWNPFEETNPHLLVCGFSGSGKTQTLKTIVSELSLFGIPSIIFDFKGDTFKIGNILDVSKVSINPLDLDFTEDLNPERIWKPKDKSLNVSHAFDKIFALGDQQRAKLADAFLESYHARGITDEDPESWKKPSPSLKDVEQVLDRMAEDPKLKSTIFTLKGRLQTIFWKEYFSSPTSLPLPQLINKTTTINFSQIRDQESKTAIAEVILEKLLTYMYAAGPSRQPRFYIVIDEGHRLAYDRSALELLAREAREYGVGIIVASQFMKDFKKEVLGNLSTIISYQMKPSEEARYAAQQLGEPITENYLLHELKEPFKGVVKLGKTGFPQKFTFLPSFKRTEPPT